MPAATVALAPQTTLSAPWQTPGPAGWRALGLAFLTVVGSFALYPLWVESFNTWANDPLRSIGAAFPAIALLGVLAAWRRTGWQTSGTWWGLALVALSLPLARVFDVAAMVMFVRGQRIGLVHPGPVFLLYGIGATLLFGGPRLLRAALAPLLLLLALNPVPYFYNTQVDLPLQMLSANTARVFSHLIGLRPTGEQLQMMFTPQFGMLIVPGCNGVRGSITFAYLALIFGYSRRLQPRTLAWVTASAFLLGYALNLLRLCVLVVYYKVGISFPGIQPYGVGVDYWIGCTIFLCATLALGLLIRALEPRTPAAAPPVPGTRPLPVLSRALCFGLLVCLFIVPQARLLAVTPIVRPDRAAALAALPPEVGPYHLARSYYENDTLGNVTAVLGDYTASVPGGESRLTLGLWLTSGNHLLALSRLTQGVRSAQNGSFQATAVHGLPVTVATSFFDDGVTRDLVADAACSVSACADHVVGSATSTFTLQMPAFKDFFVVPDGRRLPLFLERGAPDTDPTPSGELIRRFQLDAATFLSHMDLVPLVNRLGSRP